MLDGDLELELAAKPILMLVISFFFGWGTYFFHWDEGRSEKWLYQHRHLAQSNQTDNG